MYNLSILIENLTNGYKGDFLNFLSIASIFFGISVIVAKNPIVSVLFLITLFCTVASYLITLGMHFIGLSYLLVYVGAISILFLFILMLINVRISELTTDTANSIPLAISAGLAFAIPVYAVLPFDVYVLDIVNIDSIYSLVDKLTNNQSIITLSNTDLSVDQFLNKTGFVTSKIWDGVLSETSHISSIGNIMYTNVFIWLLVTSLILLLAMVGAIIITIKTTNKSQR